MTDEVCCLTPPGVSAIAVVGLRGPGVWAKVSPYFRAAGRQPELGAEPSMTFGRIQRGDLGDEVVLVLQGDARYQNVEVQCHGGPGVVSWVLGLAGELGCRRVEWEEWLGVDAVSYALSESGGKYSGTRQALLARAVTKRAASILLDQCGGALDRAVASIRREMAVRNGDREKLLAEVRTLRKWEGLGRHLVEPWTVVLAGPANAGKSSLFNALLGFERAITSPTPGTTRDLVTATLVWKGLAFELIDTAGLREAGEDLEAAGMERAVRILQSAAVVLWLLDLSSPEPALPAGVCPTFLVGSKADLPAASSVEVDFRVSSRTGEGIEVLLKGILRQVLPEEPLPGQAVPVLECDREELRRLEEVLTTK